MYFVNLVRSSPTEIIRFDKIWIHVSSLPLAQTSCGTVGTAGPDWWMCFWIFSNSQWFISRFTVIFHWCDPIVWMFLGDVIWCLNTWLPEYSYFRICECKTLRNIRNMLVSEILQELQSINCNISYWISVLCECCEIESDRNNKIS